jgi:apolipoprotein N-acyltransferase
MAATDRASLDLRPASLRLSGLRNVALFLAGGLSALGFAPLGLWPLTLLGLALFVRETAAAQRSREAARLGWVFGVGHFLVGLNWIATAFTYQDNMPAWIGWAAVVLLSLYLALFPALAALLAWRLSHQHRLGFALALAAAWMLSEWLRATLLTGFAWDPVGVFWLELPWVAQGARWIGTYGLSGLAVLVAGLLWFGLYRNWRVTAVAAIGLIASVEGLGHLLPTDNGQSDPHAIPFRVVQPNIGQDEKYNPEEAERNTQIYARLSGHPGTVPRLLLWPEGATLHFLDIEADARAQLTTLLGSHDLLITGGPSVILDLNGNNDVYHNSVFALDSTGSLRWRYDKAHLVPFGEYLPARPILGQIGLARLVPGDGDFSSGPGPQTFVLPGFSADGRAATIGVQICYEIIFSGHVVDEARRPTFLFNPSNDAWFGAWGPPQHLAQARLRAIEEGIPIIRATPNGISALISPRGQLLATVASHREGVIDGQVPLPLPPTMFSKLGLWASALFGLLLTSLAVLLRAVPAE